MKGSSSISHALAPLEAMLAADGYELHWREDASSGIQVRIAAGPDACEDCLVPKSLMHVYFVEALKPVCSPDLPRISLVYPGELD